MQQQVISVQGKAYSVYTDGPFIVRITTANTRRRRTVDIEGPTGARIRRILREQQAMKTNRKTSLLYVKTAEDIRKIARLAGEDAGNRRMRSESRDVWNAEDWNHAAAVMGQTMAKLKASLD